MAFIENSDPIKDLGIGYEAQILKWFENYMMDSGNTIKCKVPYTFDDILVFSALEGKDEYVKFLLKERDADPTSTDSQALCWAVRSCNVSTVKILLKNKKYLFSRKLIEELIIDKINRIRMYTEYIEMCILSYEELLKEELLKEISSEKEVMKLLKNYSDKIQKII